MAKIIYKCEYTNKLLKRVSKTENPKNTLSELSNAIHTMGKKDLKRKVWVESLNAWVYNYNPRVE